MAVVCCWFLRKLPIFMGMVVEGVSAVILQGM